MGVGQSLISSEGIARKLGFSNQMSDELALLISSQPLPEDLDTFMESVLLSLNFSESSNHKHLSDLLKQLSRELAGRTAATTTATQR
ncbi:hypothetical protein SAMD00019534_050160 [Acytostelium subglobosum LB1]|uniref:hypothetical protein n=1 Tax=Acytostelium subglobosum LB1 TaxID=1410327 RepID=UPI000644E05B|nr:hypothetical protein SAMD00019534_050160 [Acytostelium subglobosum LB1]GAM21841.1 hypothetical protein SAMD00019534_050160 [Acytostelium subglobosum LB1]|eukprot:XP_012754941.1 hypothetical protein SAMD00019534_050160 [Acytostelium subglobosum LB1]